MSKILQLSKLKLAITAAQKEYVTWKSFYSFCVVVLVICLVACHQNQVPNFSRGGKHIQNDLRRIVVLPFGYPGRIDDNSLLLQQELAARLVLKGYDVVNCEDVNENLGLLKDIRVSPSDITGFRERLRSGFNPDTLVFGKGTVGNVNLKMIESTHIDVEVNFCSPLEHKKVLLGPFKAEVSHSDMDSLQIAGDILSGSLISAGLKTIFYVNRKVAGRELPRKQQLRRLLSYTAFMLVDQVPRCSGYPQVPQLLQVVLDGGNASPGNVDECAGKHCYGKEDRLGLTLFVKDRDFNPARNDSFRVKLLSRDGVEYGQAFPLVSDDNGGRRWKGAYRLFEKNIDDSEVLLAVDYQHAGRTYELGAAAIVDIKTDDPKIDIVWWCIDSLVYFLCRTNGSLETIAVEKEVHGRWQGQQIDKNGCVYSFKIAPHEQFRCRVRDRHGRKAYSRIFTVPSSKVVRDKFCNIFVLENDPCDAFLDLSSEINYILQDVLRNAGCSYSAVSGVRVIKSQVYCLTRLTENPKQGFVVKMAGNGGVLLHSSYHYGCEREDSYLGAEDQQNLRSHFGGPSPILSSAIPPPPPDEPEAPHEREETVVSLLSLREAENFCRQKGGRLLTEKEWLEYLPGFETPYHKGEYVEGGMMRYRAGSMSWCFEKVFQPYARNLYRTRCYYEQ